jgi:large subunit ribosomal protein L25
MSEKLVAQSKSNDGKLAVNAKRKKGLIPVNLYGPGIENSHSYYIDELALNRAIKSGKKIHEITSDVGDFKIVMKEVQRHPVTWRLVHVDMLSLKPGMRVTVTVPLRFEGLPYGVKNMGGVFIINSRDITIEALAEHIPKRDHDRCVSVKAERHYSRFRHKTRKHQGRLSRRNASCKSWNNKSGGIRG